MTGSQTGTAARPADAVMIEMTIEEYAFLVWCAIHGDRALPDPEAEIGRHWSVLPPAWKDRFSNRLRLARTDALGAQVRQP